MNILILLSTIDFIRWTVTAKWSESRKQEIFSFLMLWETQQSHEEVNKSEYSLCFIILKHFFLLKSLWWCALCNVLTFHVPCLVDMEKMSWDGWPGVGRIRPRIQPRVTTHQSLVSQGFISAREKVDKIVTWLKVLSSVSKSGMWHSKFVRRFA